METKLPFFEAGLKTLFDSDLPGLVSINRELTLLGLGHAIRDWSTAKNGRVRENRTANVLVYKLVLRHPEVERHEIVLLLQSFIEPVLCS
jgi:hypothetical protein